MNTKPVSLCEEVSDDIARVLDGTAAPELYEHIEECDRCRDLRHEAAYALEFVSPAGSDFLALPDLEARLCAVLDKRADSPTTVSGVDSATVVSVNEDVITMSSKDSTPTGGGSTNQEKDSPQEKITEVQKRMSDEEWAILKGSAESPSSDTTSPEPSSSGTSTNKVRSLRPRVLLLASAILAAAAAVPLLFKLSSSTSSPSSPGILAARSSWSAEVSSIARSSDAPDAALRCDPGGSCAPLAVGDKIGSGSLLRTARHGRVQLRMSDGSQLVLDHDSELLLRDDQARSARLLRGGVLADIAHLTAAPNARFAFPSGSLEVLGTKFVIRSVGDRSSVQVARGIVQLSAEGGSSERVFAGEEGRVTPDHRVNVFPTPIVSEGFGWSDRLPNKDKPRPGEDPSEPLRGLGELRARKPGQQDEKDGVVRLTKHSVQVRIVDGVARTEIDETFHNDSSEELEGIFRFPLPADAQIERLALEVNGKLEEGAFVEKDRGQAIWRGVIQNAAPKAKKPVEEIIWVPGPWRDPALLEWKRGGRFELRIFPIPARGARRVVLAYTQTVPAVGGMRRYTYPLPYDGQGKSTIESFQIKAQVRGQDLSQGVKTTGYAMQETQENGASSLEMKESGFRPSGDLVLEYAMPNPQAEVTAWAYQPASAQGDDGNPYVALALRPKLPRRKDKVAHEQVFVVDTSRSMVGERLRRAKALVGGMIRELDDSDHVQVLACDVGCREWGEGSVEAGSTIADSAERFLEAQVPDGTTNLAAMMKEGRIAGERSRGSRVLNVVYVGDGGASVGATKPDHLEAEVRRVLRGSEARVTAIALGSDADVKLLEAMSRGGGGVVVPYIPGERVSEASLSAVLAMNGVVLQDAALELPSGFVSVAPSKLEPVRAGSEVWVVGRMTSKNIEGEATLRGKVGGESFEQKYTIKVEATEDKGNAFVPRQYAWRRIEELEKSGGEGAKKAIEDLSKRYSVASRYTSMLVLESEAMMKAFGLNRASEVPQWTGDALAVRSESESESKRDDSTDFNAYDDGESTATGKSAQAPMRAGIGGAAAPAAKPAPPRESTRSRGPTSFGDFDGAIMPERRRMVPMKRVWDRKGAFFPDLSAWRAREESKLISAEGSLAAKPDSRNLTSNLFALYARNNRLDRATDLVEKWSSRDAIDPEALLARSDLAARAGDRSLAFRRLASIVDIRPDDVVMQTRLAEIYERMGDQEQACAHRVTLAEQRSEDTKAQTAAVRCARAIGASELADRLLADLPQTRRDAVFKALDATQESRPMLLGDVRLDASWDSDADLDLVLIDNKGRRISWQGGSKAPVSAQDVTSQRGEKVAWSNLAAGSYLLEVTRSKPGDTNPIRGSVTVRVVGDTRSIPFVLTNERAELGRMDISYTSRLVPAW